MCGDFDSTVNLTWQVFRVMYSTRFDRKEQQL